MCNFQLLHTSNNYYGPIDYYNFISFNRFCEQILIVEQLLKSIIVLLYDFSFVVSNCEFVTFPLVFWLGQVWYLIVSIPDLCTLTYFYFHLRMKKLLLSLLFSKTFSTFNLKPQLHIHDFGYGRGTIHPDLSRRDASA